MRTQRRSGSLSRRDLVARAVAAGVALPALGALPELAPAAHAAGAHPRRGGTLRVAAPAPVGPLDPALLVDDTAIAICAHVYSLLLRLDADSLPRPDLATGYTVSEDGRVWTFSLRTGVTFHSGKPFDADDAIYTVRRALDPRVRSGAASLLAGLADVQRVDAHTVRFHLRAPDPCFALVLTDPRLFIVEAGGPAGLDGRISGTGPFRLAAYAPGERALLVRNPAYFEPGLPYLDAVAFAFRRDEQACVEALNAGTVDLAGRIGPTSLGLVEHGPARTVARLPAAGFNHLRVRCDRAPFNDRRVRQALKCVVDADALRSSVADAYAPPAGPFPRLATPAPRDTARARALLAAAGYGDGLSVELVAPPHLGALDLAAAYQRLAAEAGIAVQLIVEPRDVYYGRTNDWLNVGFGVTGWAARADLALLLRQLYRSGASFNEMHCAGRSLDALIDTYSREPDPACRAACCRQLAEAIATDSGTIAAVDMPALVPHSARLHDVALAADGGVDLRAAWLG